MRDPIVLDPPGFDVAAAWAECKDYVEKCGGLAHADGSVNWRAAFGADPGCCSCPKCRETVWKWGRRVKCPECGFEYPTDWWPSYQRGVAHALDVAAYERNELDEPRLGMMRHHAESHEKNARTDPYYRHGFENPVEDAWAEHDKIDWEEVTRHGPTAE